ncbi:MAG: YybH family protein [Chitinophagales bacterium]
MTPQQFIIAYEQALATQDWGSVNPLIHPTACVTFSNGVVNRGKEAVKTAFERNFEMIKSEKYVVSNVSWLLQNESMAVYLFDFHWKGIINGNSVEGAGVGTSVLVKEGKKWLLLTEHLGRK